MLGHQSNPRQRWSTHTAEAALTSNNCSSSSTNSERELSQCYRQREISGTDLLCSNALVFRSHLARAYMRYLNMDFTPAPHVVTCEPCRVRHHSHAWSPTPMADHTPRPTSPNPCPCHRDPKYRDPCPVATSVAKEPCLLAVRCSRDRSRLLPLALAVPQQLYLGCCSWS